MENSLKFIGEVQSELKTIEDCPLQEAENAPQAFIKIFPEFLEGIDKINTSHNYLVV